MKFSLSAQASALLAMRDRGAVDAFKRHAHLRDSERDYLDGALLAAIRTLGLFAEHEAAIRELLTAKAAKP